MTTTALTRPVLFSLETLAALASLQPDQINRLVILGVLEPDCEPGGRPLFRPEQLGVIFQLQRLRAGLGLDFLAAALVRDLLARIDNLEMTLRTTISVRTTGRPPWTRIA
ncbi:MAG: hypothetical protein JWM85_1976 [Acidimicrobiaceae bacterium]|nr:hypothetical protein [Acidimicrobiaceae bacterium]